MTSNLKFQRATDPKLLTVVLATCLSMVGNVGHVRGQSQERPEAASNASATPESVFQARILPIFRSSDPSSCVQCHLSSVDLKDYILPSEEATFRSLRDQGLIDLDKPRQSRILKLIGMGETDPDRKSRRIHKSMREAEYAAFASWIEAAVGDQRLTSLPPLEDSQMSGPAVPDPVIRHGRKSRVVDSFVRHVWSQRLRCFPCHTPHEIGPDQKPARDKYVQWKEKFGPRMDLFKSSPEATLAHLVKSSQSQVAAGDQLPLLNLVEPTESLLILKPMSKLPPLVDGQRQPTYNAPVYHVGGLKIHKDDHSYKAFVAWIGDYAKVTSGEYQAVEDLPEDNWVPTQRILRIRDIPESWDVGTPVQAFVFPVTDAVDPQDRPIGFVQGTVTPRRLVNGPVILFRDGDGAASAVDPSADQPSSGLTPGSYRLKLYLDRQGKLQSDPAAMLTAEDYQGEVRLDNASWKIGFKHATWASAAGIGSATNVDSR